jgi:Histidine kinase-, DNA gyrase B-, and HSP90-like ATPase/His Kinase A (phospho-acceptor) domain
MTRALAANLAAQRDFVANASHQLRTPLTGLRLRLEAIRGEGGYAADEAAKAEAELDRLNELVDDLLALERASSGDSRAQPVDLSEIAREAAERWGAAAAAELRYCPPGTSITISTVAWNGEVALLVADTGPGIPPADRERIFERFYRGANGRAAHAGTGLGLAIVAEIVHRWGGDVHLLDGPGHASRRYSRPRLPFLHHDLAFGLQSPHYGGHMRTLRVTLIVLAALAVPALLALGVHLAAGSSLTAPPPLVARVSTTPIAAPAPAQQSDLSGPCDEVEHRNDPRCAGTGTTTTTTRTTAVDDNGGRHSGTDDSGSSSGKGRGRGRSGGDD